MIKYGIWKVMGIDKDGKEEDITHLLTDFLQNQIDEEIQNIEDDEEEKST